AEPFGDIGFLDRTRAFAGVQIGIAIGILLLAGLLLLASARKPAFGHVLGVLGIAEITVFALAMRASFPIALLDDPILRRLRAEKPGDYRVLNLAGFPNSAMRYGMYDLWGYEPAVPGRYAAFMKRTQGRDPDDSDIYLDFEATDPLLIMARLRFLILPEGKGIAVKEASQQWPHLFLVGDYQVVSGRDAIYNAIHQSGFDPLRQIVLESRPDPAPAGTPPAGRARLLQQTTDALTIEAETDRPALLVVTDAYSRGWRAVALPGSRQQQYTVMPANYIFRAVPLQAGKHRLRMEYAPWEFPVGLGISLSATGLYLILLVRYAWRVRRTRMARREP
ncbi:MAG: YfhO family protein, partial [Chthonomonadaceae bacterium]|nr:YfhO family protein [Chthonomonadaceae bacterium]